MIQVSFLPGSFFHEQRTAGTSTDEIDRNTVSFNISDNYAYDLIVGNEYDSDGKSYRQNNICSANRFRVEIHNASLLSSKCLEKEGITFYNSAIAKRIKASENRFLLYQSCITRDIVLIPCYEVARYFFFSDTMITCMLMSGDLHQQSNIVALKIFSKRTYWETPDKSNSCPLPNVALQILNDPLFSRTANLLSSNLKAQFYMMFDHFGSNSAFIDCLIPCDNPICLDATFAEVGKTESNKSVYMLNQIVNVYEKNHLRNPLAKSIISSSKQTTELIENDCTYWPGLSSTSYDGFVSINCKGGEHFYQRNFTLNRNDRWWAPGMTKQITLDISNLSAVHTVLPLSKKIRQMRAAEKESQEKSQLALKQTELEYEQSAGYILRVFDQLRAMGWTISYLNTVNETALTKEPVKLAVNKKACKLIIAKVSMLKYNGFSSKKRIYSFYVFECLDLIHGPHRIAIVHSLNLKSIGPNKIKMIVEIGTTNKFFWSRCHSRIIALKLKLEMKSRSYDWWRHEASAEVADQYFKKSIKEVQTVERGINIIKCNPHLFKLDM